MGHGAEECLWDGELTFTYHCTTQQELNNALEDFFTALKIDENYAAQVEDSERSGLSSRECDGLGRKGFGKYVFGVEVTLEMIPCGLWPDESADTIGNVLRDIAGEYGIKVDGQLVGDFEGRPVTFYVNNNDCMYSEGIQA